jgi:tRNA pseudouridine38-40 synthase
MWEVKTSRSVRTIRLTLQYDGTDYAGWQRQENARSIQAIVEDAIAEIEGKPVTIMAAGRTDAGVHALAQVASVRLEHGIACDALLRALNARFPHDIRVTGAAEAEEPFHARFDAVGKQYRYRLLLDPVASPFERRFAWHVGRPLDLTRLDLASAGLVGTHDFAAFQGAGSAVRTTVRTIVSAGWTIAPSPWGSRVAVFSIEGSGFLRHMVRTIVGTLLEVEGGRRPAEEIAGLLTTKDRSRAGPTAPARGLVLAAVRYPDEPPPSLDKGVKSL